MHIVVENDGTKLKTKKECEKIKTEKTVENCNKILSKNLNTK